MTRIPLRAAAAATLMICVTASAFSKLQGQTPAPLDTTYADYGDDWISLPLGIGLGIPEYNRVDGLVLPWGPQISLANDRIRIDPTVSYRSHIGKFDPFVVATARTRNGFGFEIAGGRGTFTNDAWIRSGIINSLAALAVGSDSRNYFRGDRGWAMISKEFGFPGLMLTPAVGARFENDWSTGVPVRHTTAPWSAFGKADTLKMRRTNPAISRGHLNSGLARLIGDYERGGVKGSFDGLLEHSFRMPPTPGLIDPRVSGASFTQLTLHAAVGFPTFGTQRFDFLGHTVLTVDRAPPQRYAYLGGAGTLATVDLLALGGDGLFFVEGEYSIPIDRIMLPIVGSPVVSARYAAGSAGTGDLPDFIQNIGVGLGVRLIKIEYHIDPNYRKTSFTHKHAFAVSLSLAM